MTELIIFDWDDVFTLGSTDGYYKCYHKALDGVGVTLDPQEEDTRIRSKWGSGHAARLDDLLREHPDKVSRAIELYEENFFGDTFIDCLCVVPGSQELVSDLPKDYKLAIATGGHPRMLKERILAKFHFPDVFSQIVTIYDIDDILHAKPYPYKVNKILADEKHVIRSFYRLAPIKH